MPANKKQPSGLPSGEHFFCVPDWVIDVEELSPYERLLAVFLYRRHGGDTKPFPARTTMASDIGVSVRTVDRAIKGLKTKAVIADGKIYPMLKVEHRYKNKRRVSSEYTLPPLIKPVKYNDADKSRLLPDGQLGNTLPATEAVTVNASQAGKLLPGGQLPLEEEVQQEEVQQQKDVVVLLQSFKITKEKALALLFESSEDKIRRHVQFYRKAVRTAREHHKDITLGKLIDAIEKDYNTQYWLRFIATLAGKKHKGDPLYDLPGPERDLALELREKCGIDVGVTIIVLDTWSIEAIRSARKKGAESYEQLVEILKGE